MRTIFHRPFGVTLTGALVLAAAASAIPAAAQTNHLALGVTAEQARKPEEALKHFQAALAQNADDYEANWRAAAAAVEVAQLPPDTADTTRPSADSLYPLAEDYARHALSLTNLKPEGHFAVAYVLGSRSLVSDPLTRLSMAAEIWQEATETIKLDPKHDGAYHVLGQWYAEIMRLSPFEASYAKGELGEIAENATWELALKNLEKAVELAPTMIYHRLDLARAYHDTARNDDARAQLDKIDALPVVAVRDPVYKEQAKTLRAEWAAAPAPASAPAP